MNLNTMYHAMNRLIAEVTEKCRPVAATQLGLDERCCDLMLLCDEDGTPEAIVVVGNSAKRYLEYFGGFEYIDQNTVTRIESGDECITIYPAFDARVTEALDYYAEHHASTSDEDEDTDEEDGEE